MTILPSKPSKPYQPQPSPWEDEVELDNFKPLTHQEAEQWRQTQAIQSPWLVVKWQLVLMLVVTTVAGLALGWLDVAVSVAYGGLCILVPTALMAYGMTASSLSRWVSQVYPGTAGAALAGLFFWEGVKILLAIALMALAPSVISNLNWLALVVGLVVVLKAYWLAFFIRRNQ